MTLTDLLQKRGLNIDNVEFISVLRRGFLISTFQKALFDYLEYDGRLMELSLYLTDVKQRLYWRVDEIKIQQNIDLTLVEDD